MLSSDAPQRRALEPVTWATPYGSSNPRLYAWNSASGIRGQNLSRRLARFLGRERLHIYGDPRIEHSLQL
jgi:hypothetical protein